MGLLDSAKRFASGMVQNAANTSLVKNLQSGLQQYAYNRQQGVPLGQGGTGNSVFQALTSGRVGPAQGKQDLGPGGAYPIAEGVPQPKQQPQPQPKQEQQGEQPAGDQINMDQMYNVNGQMKSGRTIMAETGGTGVYGGGGGGGGVGEQVPSAEEKAKQAQEERMRRYGEVVAPVQKDIEAYLSSRRPITDLFTEQMAAQGIPGKQANLGLLEGEVSKLGTQLSTIPGEEIARRKETGMLTAAAERRIRSKEEQPIREQLLKTETAKENERIGLERAFQLVDKYLSVLREQEQRQLEPLTARLQSAQAEFGEETKAMADRLTGFTEDRKATLKQYENRVAAGVALTKQQDQQAADLKLQEAKHLNAMEEITARSQGKDATFTAPDQLEEIKVDIQSGMDEAELKDKWLSIISLESMNWILKEYGSIMPAGEERTM